MVHLTLQRKCRYVITKLPILRPISGYVEPQPHSLLQAKSHRCDTLHRWSSVRVVSHWYWEETTWKDRSWEEQSWAGQRPSYLGGPSIEEDLRDGNTLSFFLTTFRPSGCRGRFPEDEAFVNQSKGGPKGRAARWPSPTQRYLWGNKSPQQELTPKESGDLPHLCLYLHLLPCSLALYLQGVTEHPEIEEALWLL